MGVDRVVRKGVFFSRHIDEAMCHIFQVLTVTLVHLKDDTCPAMSHVIAQYVRTPFSQPLLKKVNAIPLCSPLSLTPGINLNPIYHVVIYSCCKYYKVPHLVVNYLCDHTINPPHSFVTSPVNIIQPCCHSCSIT